MNNRLIALICAGFLQACDASQVSLETSNKSCADTILEHIEQQLPTGDSQGHGPDVGSTEWHSVVEFKLGVRGKASVPKRHTEKWCDYVLEKLDGSNPE